MPSRLRHLDPLYTREVGGQNERGVNIERHFRNFPLVGRKMQRPQRDATMREASAFAGITLKESRAGLRRGVTSSSVYTTEIRITGSSEIDRYPPVAADDSRNYREGVLVGWRRSWRQRRLRIGPALLLQPRWLEKIRHKWSRYQSSSRDWRCCRVGNSNR